jgi:hypothetical protein
VTDTGVDELLDQIVAELAPDVDGLALEVLRRLVIRRTRELLAAGDVGDQEHDHNDVDVERLCTRCRNRPADPGYRSCTRCRQWAREERRRLRARQRSDAASASENAATGSNTQPALPEVELAAAGARGPRAAEIAQGLRNPNMVTGATALTL